ncbi:PREDICTED: dnaJ homolog subfamily C member 9 [Charadrius vociferus]|uniref:dnaJ homolog subfamily C member 9 n=1 Tax=Charadrius vociferus TaxID=50402 RepID=UPI0005212621|nr:PREDICTED: dnaJ homolog subfamily C member 9 [Charadrius vociferus]
MELVKKLAGAWKELPASQKQVYEEARKTDWQRYSEQLAAYKAKLTPAQAAALKEERRKRLAKRRSFRAKREMTVLGKPKRPRSGFNIFVSENFQESEGISPAAKLKQLFDAWRKLSSTQKQEAVDSEQGTADVGHCERYGYGRKGKGSGLPHRGKKFSGSLPSREKENSSANFQILGKAYAVLSDAEQRAVYDEQGRVDEDGEALRGERDWQEYWRLLFKKITVKDIEDFEKSYKDSEEELADIKAAYVDFEGDMDRIMESVLCVDYTDEPRIRKIIEKAIDSGEVPSYKGFVKESKQKMLARKRRAEKEAREAEKTKDELGLGGEDDLKALIQSRNKDRKKEMDDFLAQLEAKYGNNAKKGGKKTAAKKGKK